MVSAPPTAQSAAMKGGPQNVGQPVEVRGVVRCPPAEADAALAHARGHRSAAGQTIGIRRAATKAAWWPEKDPPCFGRRAR